jgi:tRNA uridine 5-carboxymethylaminomethyl modification enzyme
VSQERQRQFEQKQKERAQIENWLEPRFASSELRAVDVSVKEDGVRRSLAEWLRFPEVDAEALRRLVPQLSAGSEALLDEVVQDHRYAPYITRQQSEIIRLRADEAVRLPEDLDYSSIAGLSNEMIERLSSSRPATLGAASRVRGVTPAALAAILVYARRRAA